MNKFDWFLLMGIVLIMLVGIFGILYYFNYQNGKCAANPFVYGSQQLEKTLIDTKVHGTIVLLNSESKTTPVIEFNSTGIRILE